MEVILGILRFHKGNNIKKQIFPKTNTRMENANFKNGVANLSRCFIF